MLSESTFDTGELRINYAEGPNNGPPLLVLTGLTMNWQNMGQIISPLIPNWHLYTIDFRGHGKSDRATSYRVVDYVDDTATFLSKQIEEPAFVVGYSLGGLVAMGLGPRLPNQIRGIVLIDPGMIARNTDFEAAAYSFAHSWILRTHHVNTQNLSIADIVAILKETFPDTDDDTRLATATMLHSVDTGATATFINNHALDGFSMASALKAINSPILLIHGEEAAGSVVRESDIAFFHNHVPQGKRVKIEGWGHELTWPTPAQIVVAHMNEFLDGLS